MAKTVRGEDYETNSFTDKKDVPYRQQYLQSILKTDLNIKTLIVRHAKI